MGDEMIGLLTFQNADNYGAAMQAYALQRVIEEEGRECEYLNIFINTKKVQGTSNINPVIMKLKKFKNIKKKITIRVRSKKFEQFRREYIKISNEKYTDKTIKDSSRYDSYIVGSDQIWNLDITNDTLCFFLHFAPKSKKKSSYATSIGLESLSERQKEIFAKYLPEFDNISVRENKGAELIESFTEKEINVCLDPTLLLDNKVWSALAKAPKHKNYVLIYAMADSDTLVKKAKELARENGLKVIAVGLKKDVKGVKNIRTASPQEWLGLIRDASIVVTNSFHGTAFSLNFNKNFYLEYLPAGWSVNSRLKNISQMFGIQERIIGEKAFKKGEIDYDNANAVLEKEREKSLGYLRSIL